MKLIIERATIFETVRAELARELTAHGGTGVPIAAMMAMAERIATCVAMHGDPVATGYSRCDGEHAMPPCEDPNCFQVDPFTARALDGSRGESKADHVHRLAVEPPGDASKAIADAAQRAHVGALAVLEECKREWPLRRNDTHESVADLAKVVAELAVAVKDAARYL